jgi:hypothetical protein
MQHERHDLDGDDLAEIWRSAQHRRTEDVYSWFTNIFKKRQQLKSPDTRPDCDGVFFRSLTSQARTFLPSSDSAGGSQRRQS